MTLIVAQQAPPATPLVRSPGIGTLERLLEAGWQIEPPVLIRLAWAQHNADEVAYHFILRRDAQCSLVVIADSPELQRFLAANAIAVA
ncbi:MAG TPA: hypothetical protein VGJ87_14520 [Roseiflexaceae bacterium]|jgi:hypothetical protein